MKSRMVWLAYLSIAKSLTSLVSSIIRLQSVDARPEAEVEADESSFSPVGQGKERSSIISARRMEILVFVEI